MATLKGMRVIDSRNMLFGEFKYQVRPGRLGIDSRKLRQWCYDRWGPRDDWTQSDSGAFVRVPNTRYRIAKGENRTTLLYLKSDDEAVLFSLVWGDYASNRSY